MKKGVYQKKSNSNIDLINANSYDYLKYIPSNSIDFVCIDPPYVLDNHGGCNGNMKRKIHDNHIVFT